MVPITDPNQLTLPGVEPVKNSDLLTKEMRIELTVMIKGKFNEKAEENADDISPPLELEEQAKTYMQENWEEGMTDGEKWNFVKHDTDIINDKEGHPDIPETAPAPGLPKFYDPLNDTSGKDYKKTQWLARNLSITRAVEVIAERGIQMKPGVVPLTAIRRVDNELWSAWKGSSTSQDGLLLQVATADELGGRLNPKTGHGGRVQIDKDAVRAKADKDYEGIGGYNAIKAYVRAKWETTQYLLDKAGINELKLYRGIALELDTLAQAEREKMLLEIRQMVEGHAKVPTNVVRNGAASTTTNSKIANGWSQSSTRLVLRISAPRTAAISIPAYGINIKSEQEVVIAGTAWKGWDSWLGSAPDFEKVKLAA